MLQLDGKYSLETKYESMPDRSTNLTISSEYQILFQWTAGSSSEAAETEPSVTEAEAVAAASAVPDTPTDLSRPEIKPEGKAKPEVKAEIKVKAELKVETKTKPEAKPEVKCKPEPKTEVAMDCTTSSPPSRRRASADATGGTPERKKRRLTRPRKLWAAGAPPRRPHLPHHPHSRPRRRTGRLSDP